LAQKLRDLKDKHLFSKFLNRRSKFKGLHLVFSKNRVYFGLPENKSKL